MSEQAPSNEKPSVLEIVHRPDDPIGPWALQLLREGDLEPWVILRSTRPFEIRPAHEPRDGWPTDEHVARFGKWLTQEMPAGTVIGDPNWWPRKLLNAAYLYAAPPASSTPPASEPRALQRYVICGRLMPLSENGIQQLTVVGEASYDVYLCADVDGAAQPPVPALRDVVAERERQKSVEGWTPEHDDEHEGGALAVAGAAYAYYAAWHQRDRKNSDRPPQLDCDEILTSLWPFDEEWWKPKDPRRDLVRAAALILAEIERLDRATATKGVGHE